MTNENNNQTRRGRKSVNVTFPNTPFTLNDLVIQNQGVSKSSAYLYISKGLKNGKLVKSGEVNEVKSKGRKKLLYSMVEKGV